MDKIEFIRTDLALECREAAGLQSIDGIEYSEEKRNGIRVQYMHITNKRGSEALGKEPGRYVTAEVGKVWLMTDEKKAEISDLLCDIIRSFITKAESVLVVGLGNRDVTADALGPEAVDGLTVTRHVKSFNIELFEQIGGAELSALAPGVVGQTGIETFEIIKGAVDAVAPDVCIVIDALAARSVDRLATTVQISDTGIAPGSGIGNKRKKINAERLGVPVIAIGVPTVVDSSTLVCDALEQAGIENISRSLRDVLENSRSFFVSLKENDVAVAQSASLIACAINKAVLK